MIATVDRKKEESCTHTIKAGLQGKPQATELAVNMPHSLYDYAQQEGTAWKV